MSIHLSFPILLEKLFRYVGIESFWIGSLWRCFTDWWWTWVSWKFNFLMNLILLLKLSLLLKLELILSSLLFLQYLSLCFFFGIELLSLFSFKIPQILLNNFLLFHIFLILLISQSLILPLNILFISLLFLKFLSFDPFFFLLLSSLSLFHLLFEKSLHLLFLFLFNSMFINSLILKSQKISATFFENISQSIIFLSFYPFPQRCLDWLSFGSMCLILLRMHPWMSINLILLRNSLRLSIALLLNSLLVCFLRWSRNIVLLMKPTSLLLVTSSKNLLRSKIRSWFLCWILLDRLWYLINAILINISIILRDAFYCIRNIFSADYSILT